MSASANEHSVLSNMESRQRISDLDKLPKSYKELNRLTGGLSHPNSSTRPYANTKLQNIKCVLEGVEESRLRLMTKSEMKNLQLLVCLEDSALHTSCARVIHMSGHLNTVVICVHVLQPKFRVGPPKTKGMALAAPVAPGLEVDSNVLEQQVRKGL